MKKNNIIIFISLLILSCFVSTTVAKPSISLNNENILTNNVEYSFKAESCGPGPKIILFDNFEQNTIDNEISLIKLQKGEWSSAGTYVPITYDDGHSGSKSMMTYSEAAGRQRQVIKQFNEPITKIYFSYYVKIPAGSYFPAATTENTLSSVSSWKFSWIYDGEKGYMGDDDLYLPGWGGGFYVSGNDGRIYTNYPNDYTNAIDIPKTWWGWDNWIRISFGMIASEDDISKDKTNEEGYSSYFFIEFINENNTITKSTYNNCKFFDGDDNSVDNSISQWTQINFPGWIKENATNCKPLYDDIYIATGDNALSRIEIGNNKNFYDCTHRELQVPISWPRLINNASDDSQTIKIKVNRGSFGVGDSVYLFIVDSNGIPSDGVPVTIK